MGSDMQNLLLTLLLIAGGITAFILAIIFVAVPLFRGVGLAIGGVFKFIGWLIMHLFEYIGGTLKDIVRFVGALIAMIVLLPFVPLNIVIGRWSAAGHFAESVKRECKVGSLCVYRFAIRRPLRLLMLDGLLEGLEQRVPEAVVDAPTSDKPGKRTGQFDGYTILGSLRAGGSGAKLYVAEPSKEVIRKHKGMGERVVIKSFALTEGSSLPQIVRESRALECAKQMGLVLDHGMDNHRFYYIMPYHPGEHLGAVTRQLHGESEGRGLNQRQLNLAMGYLHDLLGTLSQYHVGGLWHKDVKPENIIIHDGRAHLVDLGLVTPLRSAMTLTTHGTEYFRDPEMVRQALRGVKVHQVNGVKFDVYAAGAVLYFMLENTFPAHGGLSRFVANSPEALRWIVRRSMTEYHQRYETADAMLADLQYVAAARDAFAVKPAELPSMRGVASPQSPSEVMVNATGMDDVDAVEAFQAGRAKAYTVAIPVGAAASAGGAGAPATAGGALGGFQRAKLSLTNWWTGAYKVDQMPSGVAAAAAGASVGGGSPHDPAVRDFRAQAAAFRVQAEGIARQARSGAISARKAAREQIKAARERARDMRSRAMNHRQRVAPHSSESMWAVTIGVLSVLFLATMIGLAFFARPANSSRNAMVSNAGLLRGGAPIVIVIDTANPLNEAAQRNVNSIIKRYKDDGYDVIVDAPDVASIVPAIQKWRKYQDRDSDQVLEDYMARVNAYAIVHVPVTTSKKSGRQTVKDTQFIYSEADGAKDRRRPGSMLGDLPATPSKPYLLINDHPAKADPKVEEKVQALVKAYLDRGWAVLMNDEAEVALRSVLPSGPIDDQHPLPQQVHSILAKHGFAGIMRIEVSDGEAPPQERVRMTRIDGDPTLCEPAGFPGTHEFEIVTPPLPPAPVEPLVAASRPSLN